LEISRPAEINRVMVGRIELVTPQQRNTLQQIAGFSTNEISHDAMELAKSFCGRFFPGETNGLTPQRITQLNAELAQVCSGQKRLSSYISIPKTYQTYLELGRFRNALILDEAKRHLTQGLANFIATYRLQSFIVQESPIASKPQNVQVASH
jgi:hypothetical protein